MWIFLKNSFISIVQKPEDTDGMLTVRARVKGDIERAFPDTKVKVTKGQGTDYLYRARIPREIVAAVISNQIMDLNYPNFKGDIKNDAHHDACMAVWNVMCRHQREMDAYQTQKRGARQVQLAGFQ